MVKIKSPEEIELMRESAQIVSKTLGMLAKAIQPGVTTIKLDKLAEEFIHDHGAKPGFLGLYDFPNEELIQELLQSNEITQILIAVEEPNEELLEGLHQLVRTTLQEGQIERAFGIAMVFEYIG